MLRRELKYLQMSANSRAIAIVANAKNTRTQNLLRLFIYSSIYQTVPVYSFIFPRLLGRLIIQSGYQTIMVGLLVAIGHYIQLGHNIIATESRRAHARKLSIQK